MAGDVKTTESGEELPEPPIDNPFPSIQETLDALLADQRMEGWEIIALSMTAAAASARDSQHPRMRVRYIIASQDTGDPYTLLVGSRGYTFVVSSTPSVFPFPILIERGVDVQLTHTGNVTAAWYLVGEVE